MGILNSRFHGNDDIPMAGMVESDVELFSVAEFEQESRGVESPVLAGGVGRRVDDVETVE